ncbi:MAG TPA: SDR family NAD(P)-dependent oxidoreductase [Myxococcota bacterium]|nr:SDR family NAD(P)-dependent oxidoreductase [Myxococcota bacterium]
MAVPDADRVVVISGGTGALGRALVTRFLAGGDRVVLPWIVKRELESLESGEPEALRAGRIVALEADVTEEAGARRVAEAAAPVEVLVNAVGGYAGGKSLAETDLEVWDRMYRMNLRSAVSLTRAVLPGMLARKKGSIVNIASRAALELPAGLAAYAAAKGAVLAASEILQKEVAASGLRVNTIVPTTIDTPANRAAMPNADFSQWTPPAAIAEVIHWLSSEAAATVRGAVVPV